MSQRRFNIGDPVPDFSEFFYADMKAGRIFWKKTGYNKKQFVGKEAGGISSSGLTKMPYWYVSLGGVIYKRAHVIYWLANHKMPSPMVDHIDNNSLNDSIDNLREVNATENMHNKSGNKKRKHSLPENVYMSIINGYIYYRATIHRFGKRVLDKSFKTEAEAVNCLMAFTKKGSAE